MADEQDIKIKVAVLGEKLDSMKTQNAVDIMLIREQQKAQADTTNRQFEKVFELIRPVASWVQKNEDLPVAVTTLKTACEWIEQNKEMPATVAALKSSQDKQSGFVNASRMFAGAIGGGVVMAAQWLLGKHPL